MKSLTNRVFSMFTLLALLCVNAVPLTSAFGEVPSGVGLQKESRMETTAERIDINSANLKELRSLPGIGKVFSQKIVEGRPYQSVEDLQKRKVLPQKTFNKIQKMIVAKTK